MQTINALNTLSSHCEKSIPISDRIRSDLAEAWASSENQSSTEQGLDASIEDDKVVQSAMKCFRVCLSYLKNLGRTVYGYPSHSEAEKIWDTYETVIQLLCSKHRNIS